VRLHPLIVIAVVSVLPLASAKAAARLADADKPTLVEAALRELDGLGNSVESGPAGTPKVTVALAAADQEVLIRKVFGPFLWEAEKRQMLEKAACQRFLRASGILWTKTVGEAIEEKVCNVHLEPRDLYTNPGVKLALADALLVDHPRRAELLAEVKVAVSRNVGSTPHLLCYGAQPADPVVVDDAGCRLDWAERGMDSFSRLGTFAFERRPLDQWSLSELHEAWSALTGVTTLEAHEQAAKLKAAFTARVSKRDATVASRRLKVPVTVRAADVVAALPKSAVYLWHEACAEPRRVVVPDETGASEAEVVCVKYAYQLPSTGGCFEESFNFIRRLGGTTHAKLEPVGASQPIECP
jgi:hypothetical protein